MPTQSLADTSQHTHTCGIMGMQGDANLESLA